jgi:sterol desaturase/sphingolipid hydroxylase (fatty acid hydroxylase superfamily)
VPLAAALMDYTLYLWHVLTHRVPFLWRFHAVHHADLDLSATTALRFHFAEMAVSVPYRAAQVALLGVGPRARSVWQTFLYHKPRLFASLHLHPQGRCMRTFRLSRSRAAKTGRHHRRSRDHAASNYSAFIEKS